MSTKHLLHELGIMSKIPAAVLLIVFLSYTALVAAAVGIAEHALSKKLAEEPLPWVVALVALCTLCVSILVLQLSERLEDLRMLQRMRFKYYPSGGKSNAVLSSKMYEAATRVITRARVDGTCHIMAMNSFHEPFDPVPDNGSHRKFFDALNAILGRVNYQRLVQCASKEHLATSLSKEYRDHFERVMMFRDSEEAEQTHLFTRLDMVQPKYPTAFVIVKHSNGSADLIWQLNEYTGALRDARPVFRVRGLLIVEDPDRRLIRFFEAWFNRLLGEEGERITRVHVYGAVETLP
jgi:hypothetical protein